MDPTYLVNPHTHGGPCTLGVRDTHGEFHTHGGPHTHAESDGQSRGLQWMSNSCSCSVQSKGFCSVMPLLGWLVLNPENSSRWRNKFSLNPDQVILQDTIHSSNN